VTIIKLSKNLQKSPVVLSWALEQIDVKFAKIKEHFMIYKIAGFKVFWFYSYEVLRKELSKYWVIISKNAKILYQRFFLRKYMYEDLSIAFKSIFQIW